MTYHIKLGQVIRDRREAASSISALVAFANEYLPPEETEPFTIAGNMECAVLTTTNYQIVARLATEDYA